MFDIDCEESKDRRVIEGTEVGIESPGQTLTLLSEDGLRFVYRILSKEVLESRTFDASLCN